MRLKAFLLSIDGLISVALVASLLYVAASASWSGAQAAGFNSLSPLARDYLAIKYGRGVPFSPPQFNALTSHSITESAPSSGDHAHAEAFYYPFPLNCSMECTIANTSPRAGYLSAQEPSLLNYRFDAWVSP